MSRPDLPHRPDLDRLARLAAHAPTTSAAVAVTGPTPVPHLQAATSALLDRIAAAWATGEGVGAVAGLLVEAHRVARAWATTASTESTRPATAETHDPALARTALWPCIFAAWSGGEVAGAALAAVDVLATRLDATSPAAAALAPAAAHLLAARAGDGDTDATRTAAAAIETYRTWVGAVDTPVTAAALHEHVPALLRAATTGDVDGFDEAAGRRRRHHTARAVRRRHDPLVALDLLAVVASTTAQRHGLTVAAQLPYAPLVPPEGAS